ncbi:hypothetical protein ACFVT2_39420 [Streptomyces sp. NPDC058000]|uniref:hypothetical protein n=1 Tax=Streptomyces sp. NPDC058000 TaxID=3346299 RepID=UPI0036E2D66B
MNPFPAPYPALLGDDPALQMALDTAVSEALTQFPGLAQPFRAAISFVAVDQTPDGLDFRHAGLRFGDSYFTASLAKVGALYSTKCWRVTPTKAGWDRAARSRATVTSPECAARL